jgi:WD40 repeat protein
MDTSMDLTKENEEYKLGLPRAPPAQKNRPLTTKQEEVKVTCHLYLPIRTSLFLGTSSGTLLMWKPKNEFHAEIVRTDLTGHRGSIFSILFLGDEASSGGGWGHAAGAASLAHLVATCSADRTVKIWDVFERDLKQRCIQTLIGHEGSVTSMTFLRGSLITCSTDNSVRIWRSSPERSLLLYPFFEIVQEIWGPGGNTVPASLAGILGQAPPGAPPPKEVLKSCPFVVGRLVRAEQQLLFVGDAQGRVYTFIPPARGGFGSGPPRQLLKENLHTSDSSLGASASTTPRRPPGASTSQTPRKNGTGEMFQQVEMHGRAASIGMSAMLGAPTSSTFEFSRSHKIHSLSVSKMLVVHAESLIITLSFDHTVQVHDATSARPPYFGMENPNRCRYLSMDWDSTNQELFLSDELGFVQVWNIYIEKCLKSVKLKDEPISSISLHNPSRGEGSDRSTSQNGGGGPVGSDANPQKLLLGTAEGIEVWTIQRNVKFNEFKGHDGPVIQMLQINSTSLGSSTALALPRASASQQQVEKQKGKGKDGKMKDQLSGEPSPIPLSALISEEKYLYSCSSDYTIRQWDSYDMNCLSIIKERQSEISCMAYLPGQNECTCHALRFA